MRGGNLMIFTENGGEITYLCTNIRIMEFIEITSLDHPGVDIFASMTESRLRAEAGGLFIAESPKVINIALDAGYEPVALLAERRHLEGDAAAIVERVRGNPVYTGSREVLRQLTGYTLTRGVLCAMKRRADVPLAEVLAGARRVAVIDGVCDTTNIGAIFRSAAALGIDAVVLTRQSCDPLNRRSIRVSMGTVFLIPWTWLDGPVSMLREYGFRTVALALRDDDVAVDSPVLKQEPKLALILGTEGDGLSRNVIGEADYVARIPMARGVDSLNVAAASAVAFWELRADR